MTEPGPPPNPAAVAANLTTGRPPWLENLLRPVQAFRLRYLPVVMVYFAYGALGLIDVGRDMWVKESLSLSPAELAGIAVWLNLPWTVKMVFGELVDCVPIFGSQRRAYIVIGASLTATGLLTLAGAAGGWLVFARPDQLYMLGALLIVIGTVIQDVVADAISTEVVARRDADGNERPDADVRAELGMVQVLGRLALSAGIVAVAGISGWLAFIVDRQTVFLIGLVIPVVSVTGAFLRGIETRERRAIDWRILGGGLAFGATVLVLGVGGVPYAQEIVFVVSMTVVCTMLVLVTRELDHATRMAILFTTIIIFAFRATPGVGDGYFWYSLDVLKFDEAFYGVLRQTAALIAIAAMWMFSKQITEYPVTTVLLWITIAGTILSAPNIGLVYGVHEWTEANFGVGARTIAIIDAAASSPFAQLSMIPLLTLIAYYAPAGHRATWFALMASLMNLALVAGQLQTKYLNQVFVVGRGVYDHLGPLILTVVGMGFVIPIAAILLLGARVAKRPA
ncbi:MAG: folate/biopterin family MFS transporter [Alphaproteobacteria bacterium]|nr:folate/biopterin family MFS transporter [Alphaproteobacteria bacterium]